MCMGIAIRSGKYVASFKVVQSRMLKWERCGMDAGFALILPPPGGDVIRSILAIYDCLM